MTTTLSRAGTVNRRQGEWCPMRHQRRRTGPRHRHRLMTPPNTAFR
ncbi:conserved hypothetical protein [Streptomyces viridosporus ATCC 14672]|uniref:Uncharacterized protein n=1 Tax=Streptomyces viridosporus (strain ATCC 14672 / DSM 40746 / JCM 4963 / KCTC 9882 / NRRL B-12104 / FH 1290) TaxID=566461 RepID=D5ZVI7_STRV1|nr:conserved hypothetical protein [Streptomyces viridosporus ATCC 14672]